MSLELLGVLIGLIIRAKPPDTIVRIWPWVDAGRSGLDPPYPCLNLLLRQVLGLWERRYVVEREESINLGFV